MSGTDRSLTHTHAGHQDTSAGGRLIPGTVLSGRYRIVSLLGRGGMGEVYRADDLKLGEAVALKFLPESLRRDPDARERLVTETKLARHVSHPNVCRVFDLSESGDRHFLTMEYVDGEDLAALLKRIGHLPRQKAIDIARQLCAGLDAVHEVGILHRDLKPGNVMLDGNGRVRVTDFGIAVAAERGARDATLAGTPAYMAPEQLQAGGATRRSDIYALGLVLYELFTGRRAFEAATLDQLRRLQSESTPRSPATLVENFDPAVERAILWCLEPDPDMRPASVRAVAAALPGGDPIAAALAAGETPSPELVAASGPQKGLSAARAAIALGATLAMLAILLALADRASMLGWVAWPRSPDALEDNARSMFERLGYDSASIDHAHGFSTFNDPYLSYIRATDQSAARWRPLRLPGQFAVGFWHRQAPRALVPLNQDGRVFANDPPVGPGDRLVVTDLRGRLIYLRIVPPNAAVPQTDLATPDWSALLREAGLDMTKFSAVEPTRQESVFHDVRAAWSGVLPDYGNMPVRVEAAAVRGRPVFFELVLPWDPYWNLADAAAQPQLRNRLDTPMFRGFSIFFLIVMPIVTAAFAVRNWLSGRGDRRGGLRLAAAVFCLRLSVWILGGHHVTTLSDEWMLLTIAVGKALTDAVAIWCLYLALEPQARRLHPRFLVSWTRLIRVSVMDPIVGRDVLAGVALSTLFILFWGQLYVVVPHMLGLAEPPAPQWFPLGRPPYLYVLDAPPPETLLGGRDVLVAIPSTMLMALGAPLVYLIVLLGVVMVFRRLWPALIINGALGVILSWPVEASDFRVIGVVCSLAGVLVILSALRFGLVGMLTLWFCAMVWLHFPITTNSAAPHFGTGLLGILIIAGLAASGAFTASRPGTRVPGIGYAVRS